MPARASKNLAPKISAEVRRRAKKIRILLMDADGTLTDGRVWLISQPDDQSATEMKVFDAHDGAGLTLAMSAGIRTGIITGRESPAMRRRAKEMKIEFLYERVPKKFRCTKKFFASQAPQTPKSPTSATIFQTFR